MNNEDFWASISQIISDGFTPDGLEMLDIYAEQFKSRRIVFKRFSSAEQHGCSEGSPTHVIATILAGAEIAADCLTEKEGSFKREQQLAKVQEGRIEQWARKVGCWFDDVDKVLSSYFGEKISQGGEATVYDNGSAVVKSIRLVYYIQPLLALDRISLHNAYFPESTLIVMGFGRNCDGEFVIIAKQLFVKGKGMAFNEIADFAKSMGFKLINQHNWTYATPEIYLSDLHDENVLRSVNGNIVVIDCDIRINTPELKCGGIRTLTNQIEYI